MGLSGQPEAERAPGEQCQTLIKHKTTKIDTLSLGDLNHTRTFSRTLYDSEHLKQREPRPIHRGD